MFVRPPLVVEVLRCVIGEGYGGDDGGAGGRPLVDLFPCSLAGLDCVAHLGTER